MKKIWVLGDAVIDLLPEGEMTLRQCPGGAPANVAVGVARLGGNSGFIGCVGSDPFGVSLRDVLNHEGVDTRQLFFLPDQRTSTVLVGLDQQGERSFTFMVRPSADLFVTAEHLPHFASGEILHYCSIALSAEPSRSTVLNAVEQIHAAGGWVSFDPNIREDMWHDRAEMLATIADALASADVIKLSLEELWLLSDHEDTDTALGRFTERFQPRLLLITQGKAGVTLWQQGERRDFQAPEVQPVDTTGAGDAFVAGLLAGITLSEHNLDQRLPDAVIALAQHCGALATTAKGAMTALPKREALEHKIVMPLTNTTSAW